MLQYEDVILQDHLHKYLEVHESAMEAPIFGSGAARKASASLQK